MSRRSWTTFEEQLLREQYGKLHPAQIALRLGRTRGAVQQHAAKIGIAFDRRAELGDEFDAFLRAKHAEGWSDAEIAAEWGANIGTVGAWRRKRGLPKNAFNARHRGKLKRAAKLQYRDAGVKNLGALRGLVWGVKVFQRGWPAGLTKAEGDVLDAMEAGPATRRTLCERLGRKWRGCKSLCYHNGRGILKALTAKGMVRRGERTGTHEYIYHLLIRRARREGTVAA